MSQPPPLRSRPNLHIALTQLNGSPRQPGHTSAATGSLSVPYQSPAGTPLAKTAYSPFRSAELKSPMPYGGQIPFPSVRSPRSSYANHRSFRIKRTLASKSTWLLLILLALTVWWLSGGSKKLDMARLGASDLGKKLLNEKRMRDYQFYPATNPNIHVGSVMRYLHSATNHM